jgi:GTP-binding protein HflX
VLDRTEVILDIFANRAKTHEARLAVELAQLEYSLPRLKRMWTHLSRMKMGVGMRGPGEKQLESDRRLVEKRIIDLKRDLDVILRRKEREVAARRDRRTVSLVGYTNAGKSTLMNVLTDASVLAEDKLFATLDTRTRRWHLPGWGPVLLSDTVGFIRNLPHRLIASFKATLEEARQADLLLHVADASNPAVGDQISAVYNVLKEIGIQEKDTILVLNKIDRLHDPGRLAPIRSRYPHAIEISAATGMGLTRLASAVSDALSYSLLDLDIKMSPANGRLLAYLADKGEVLSRTFTDHHVTVHCRIDRRYMAHLSGQEAEISEHPKNGHAANGNGHP